MADQIWKQDMASRYGASVSAAGFNYNLEREDWDTNLYDMFLENRNQFISFIEKFCGGSQPSKSYKIEWAEFNQDIVSVTTQAGGDDTTIVVDTDEFLPLIKSDVLYNSSLGTFLIVTATPSDPDDVSVKKLTSTSRAGTLAAADYAAGVTYKRVYTMKDDGEHIADTDLDSISAHRTAGNSYNYIGTYEKFSKIKEHLANQNWIIKGMTKRTHQNLVKMKELMDEMEYSSFIGKLLKDNTNNVTGARGVLNYSNINSKSGDESWGWSDFTNWVRTHVKSQNRKETIPVVCNYQGLDWISRMLKNEFNTNISGQGDKRKAGMRYFEVITPMAILEMYPNYALGELFPDDSKFLSLDPATLARRHIVNMNVMSKYGVQPKRSHFFLDQHYGTQTIQLANPEKTSLLTLGVA